MVDILRVSEGRDYSRLPFECTNPYAASRRSSISSHAESEASVFSDTSIASSQSSISLRTSAGWDSSTQFDSDEETNSSSYDDVSELDSVPNSAKATHLNIFSAQKATGPELHAKRTDIVGDKHPSAKPSGPETDELKNLLSRVSVRRDAPTLTTNQPVSSGVTDKSAGCPFVKPLHPSLVAGQNSLRLRHGSSHPRRTATDPGWSKPSLVSQDERRLNFVENLVDTATELVALIWPASVNPVFPDGQRSCTPVISLRFFIRETLRRSRTSFSTLQVAMYYLALLNLSGNVPKCDFTKEQKTDNISGRALQCGRRMFLASLILASKYLQDRNYFTKAWSRISNLSVAEINRNEMALLSALDYKLHIKTTEFQRWTDCISKCTTSVQRGMQCPWSDALRCMNMWRDTVAPASSPNVLTSNGCQSMRPTCLAELDNSNMCVVKGLATQPRASTLPAHRMNLLRAGQSVCPTRPVRLPTRPPMPMHGDMQWPGMAAHLNSTTPNMPQFTASPEALAESDMSRDAPRPAGREEGIDLPMSPPKTPSPRSQDIEMREQGLVLNSSTQGADTSRPAPPPAPREPPLSLNTTPDSNDGASTFGNYLSPITNESTQTSFTQNGGPAPRLPHPSDARYQADTLDHDDGTGANENAVPELDSPSSSPSAGSFDLPSPTLETVQFMRPEQDATFKHPALDAMDTDFRASEHGTMVIPDETVATVSLDVEVETRRLARKDIASRSQKLARLSSCPVVESLSGTTIANPAEDGTCRSETKKCRSQKQTSCHRRKRGPSAFSGGLPDRTKKVMRI